MRAKEIEVKDKDALVRLFKVIFWLDEKKWETKSNLGALNDFIKTIEDLQPAQKILAHWLIDITDRTKRSDPLWRKNSPKIKNLVKGYEGCSAARDVSRLCKEHLYESNKKKKEWKLAIQAFPADVKSIWRTLIILLDYDKNIIKFMTENVEKWSKDEFTTRLAFRLYLLSYKDIGGKLKKRDVLELLETPRKGEEEVQSIRDILCEKSKFEESYKVWKSKRWHKRLWAALRDYKKHPQLSRIVTDKIEKIEGETKRKFREENFNKEQLELPGDVWNNKPSFRNNIFAELIELKDVPKSWMMPRIVRQLYDQLKKSDKNINDFYPEQFDVTFNFVPRMCEDCRCDVCPFGKDGAKLICIPGERKNCTVALVTCGYLAKCEEEGCVIKGEVGKGICRGRK